MSAFRVSSVRPAARMGLKGPDAATLLQQAGVPLPGAPNRIVSGGVQGTPAGGAEAVAVRVLRLGSTEFVLEQDEGDAVITTVRDLARSAGLRAWPVLRADCSLVISGEDAFDRLARVCAFDFAQLAGQPDMAVMTLLADISVTLALETSAPPRLRLVADPGFSTFLTHTLQSLSPDAPIHGVHAGLN